MDATNRNVSNKINRLLNSFPAVVILGARQTGKSTLAKLIGQGWDYFDLENPNHFRRIFDDPVLFFREFPNHIIFDEAQKSPLLFEVLRGVIDSNRELRGRFILTGSASFELTTQISETLAGRIGIVELHPFKMNEILGQPLGDFFKIVEEKISADTLTFLKSIKPSKDIATIKEYLFKGGYPEPVLRKDSEFWKDWMEAYFDTYINRDMRAWFPRVDSTKYRRVVSMLSSLTGTIVNRSEISRSVESSEKSCRDYLDIISGTYFWRELPAFRTSKISTTLKLPKGHFRDSGLGFFLQNVHSIKEMDLHPRLGNFFEGFVVEEVIRGIEATTARNTKYSHFRTKAGGEIDLIVEGSFGLLPIEVKFQSHTSPKSLTSMTNFLALHNLPCGIVLNNAEKPAFITDNIIEIPVGCL